MAGLYIHIPFCGQRCAYCDFYSTVSSESMAAYLNALKREMTARRGFLHGGRLDTVYVGGGTPSLLSPSALRDLLDRAAELWDCTGLREVTLEANPEDLTDEYLSRLTGFNRLSIGIQSFDDGLLLRMRRRHSALRAKEAVKASQRAGFENISVDLIYGIPGMTHARWEHTLDEALALGVQHISAYHLTIEPGTAFGKMNLEPVRETESERQYETLRRRLGDAGFEHYEISNFALPGRRALHNSAYWSGEPYLGTGPSAHSFDGETRREWVVADVEKYIAEAGTGSVYQGENLSAADLVNERIMTRLRTVDGIPEADVRAGEKIAKFLDAGLLVKHGTNIAIPAEKLLLSDYVIASLFDEGC